MSYDKQDHYYQEAKQKGLRARSAFKLQQIQNKFYIIKKKEIVVDLGAAPGGWSQVASKIVGKSGKVIAVDINHIKPFDIDNIYIMQADMRGKQFQVLLRNIVEPPVDVVIADLASNTTGNWHLDSERQIHLATLAFETVKLILKNEGNFITKVFRGPALQEFESELKGNFANIRHWRPPATRKKSAEEYIICKGFINGE
jgi:23S rRNA (uridine2552-2'-O)-methyltransferase